MRIGIVGDERSRTILKNEFNKLGTHKFLFLDELAFDTLAEIPLDVLILFNYFKSLSGSIIEYLEGKVFAIYTTWMGDNIYLRIYHVTDQIPFRGDVIYEKSVQEISGAKMAEAIVEAVTYIGGNVEKFRFHKNQKFRVIDSEIINCKHKLREVLTSNFDFGVLKLLNVINMDRKDLETIRNWRNKDEIRKWMYTDHIITPEEHFNWVHKLRTKNTAVYFLVKYDSEPVGVVGLSDINLQDKSASVGIYIGNEKFRGKGVGKLMMYVLLKFSFDILGLNRVQVEVFSGNIVAIHLYEKFFQKEGTLRELKFKHGVFRDVIVMSILKREWLSSKEEWREIYENQLHKNKW